MKAQFLIILLVCSLIFVAQAHKGGDRPHGAFNGTRPTLLQNNSGEHTGLAGNFTHPPRNRTENGHRKPGRGKNH